MLNPGEANKKITLGLLKNNIYSIFINLFKLKINLTNTFGGGICI